ncbi:MAG TPA: 16S rRNA (cytosine(1402)-N(4))-methyltransferase RsmH [Candidatus Paceibacterota bacterium]|nr:16S rRNA (cytosine(1402)-N(4))-methyltransferase RsmH [Candidatus Paceibacterota bacterium]HRZ34488.1 16S rRNA (cytosine(1402)-N(4))-methyltransferase RsmH [Candidatus Paceibacterota bacterium]
MGHIPVLLKEIINHLSLKDGEVVVDMTIGNGGHARALLQSGARRLTLLGVDADKTAIESARKNLSEIFAEIESLGHRLILENHYFDALPKILEKHAVSKIDKVLFDLGFRSDQIETPTRGFSFNEEGPLDMSFLENATVDAKIIVNEWEEDLLAKIIYGFGEERFSRRIAKAIVSARREGPIETTTQLAEIIKKAVPVFYRRSKIHPATKTFQALRIAVNRELERLEKVLPVVFSSLNPGGRIAVISFHSLEDRIVKNFFRDKFKAGQATLLTKKPIVASREEVLENPRSRSAKLRVLEKNDH